VSDPLEIFLSASGILLVAAMIVYAAWEEVKRRG
jgi:hypothetical protein